MAVQMRQLPGFLAAGIFLATIAAAQDTPSASASDFTDGLERAERFAKRGKWSQTKKLLDELLVKHEGAAHARMERARIAALMKRALFRLAYPEPDPKELLGGKLLSYSRFTGKVKIRYSAPQVVPGKSSDFAASKDGFAVHKARFRNAHSITIRGPNFMPSTRNPTVIE